MTQLELDARAHAWSLLTLEQKNLLCLYGLDTWPLAIFGPPHTDDPGERYLRVGEHGNQLGHDDTIYRLPLKDSAEQWLARMRQYSTMWSHLPSNPTGPSPGPS